MTKRLFKIPEAAAYSGRSRSTLYEAHKNGKLAFVKFGRSTLIEKAELDRFLDCEGKVVVAVAA